MPSVRSLILLSAFILVASLVGVSVSLLSPPDSGGRGHDSFGTRGLGYKALHDTLSESGVEVRRQFHPPRSEPSPATLVFLEPDPHLTGAEPVYLQSLLSWVESGGRVVVAVNQLYREYDEFAARPLSSHAPTILESLGLDDVWVTQATAEGAEAKRGWPSQGDGRTLESLFPESWTARLAEPLEVDVQAEGSLASDHWPVHKLAIPIEVKGSLRFGERMPIGTLAATLDGEEESILAAEFKRAAGNIVVVANPQLFSNRLLARADNSILAAQLCSPGGEPVYLDEFYHGLSVRGNSLYLLTQPGYLAIALGVLAMAGVTIWREAIFLGPPLPETTPSRRDVGEYIAAMGQFYSRGQGAEAFLVQEMRDGVLRELCEETKLPTETRDVQLVAGAFSRSAPRRSEQILQTFRRVDDQLADRSHWSSSQTLDAMRRLTACLSTNV